MESGKLGLSLFDVLGYLLPGYLLVLCASFVEATFLGSGYLSLASIRDNFLITAVIAYFAGHLCHAIGTAIKDRFFRHLGKDYREKNPLYEEFRKAVLNTYGLRSDLPLNSLDLYILADSYLVASNILEERSSLQVREGFHKSAAAAIGMLFLIVFGSLFVGGLRIQATSGSIQNLGIWPTIIYALLSLAATWLFWARFMFYNRMKLTNTYLLFLALVEKEKVKRCNRLL